MYKEYLSDYIISDEEDIYKAGWKMFGNSGILLVCSKDQKFKGIITRDCMLKTYVNNLLTVKDICTGCEYILGENNSYANAAYIFANNPKVNYIPVLNEQMDILDILTRDRVFWRERYESAQLPRMYYAACIYSAAAEAKALGYSSFSVIEFGVAGGNGLAKCEFHAKEISRLLGLKIEVYGFDSSQGLPQANMGYKDLLHLFPSGSFPMNRDALQKRLQFAKLVIGDIKDTLDSFIEKYSPAPIGCMLVDVDYYSSTLPILNLLEQPDNCFLPRIHMYFDDVHPEYEFQGEALAIKEFNEGHTQIKISPENMYPDYTYLNCKAIGYSARIKICHRFAHEKYNCRLNQGKAELIYKPQRHN